ncbi:MULTISPECIES: phage tail tape measure protein [Bacillus]|uniref:phage tail tape measure protein n=1 Tax=Bacillus TaxID=1386 RepID=UPI0013EE57BE|nr:MULTISPECIES: phage tail tape measure protein [Bacillus]MEC2427721.1 phage tail tape measure protein [Bacillus safensis]QII25618.1 phage tail tape measure protein [Bacillus altitudinis]
MTQAIGNMVAKVNLDDSGFNRGITGLQRQLRLTNSEMKASAAIYKNTGDKSKQLQSQVEGLNNKYRLQGRIVQEHRKRYEQLVREKGRDARETQIHARKLNDSIAVHQKLEKELRDVSKEFEHLQSTGNKAAGVFSVFKKNAGEVSEELQSVYSAAGMAGKALTGIGVAGTVAIGGAVKVAADFEKAMSRVGAVANASNDEMGRLTETARHLGATTQFTDGQVAEGMQYLAMAGYKTNNIIGAMPGLLATAAAGQTDLGVTADIVSDILTEFHIAAEDTNRVADAMTYTFTNSNATLQQIGQTMKYAGPAAKTAGVSMEELAAATGIMANSGIKADMAGTALRSTLTRLAAPPKPAGNAIHELGLSITDANGRMKPLSNIIDQINEKTKNYTETEKIRIAKQLAGQHALSGFITLLHAGGDKIDKFTKQIENSGGVAEKVAKGQMDNLAGSMEYLRSAANNAVISLGNQFIPVIRATTDGLTKIVNWFDHLPPSVMQTIAVTGAAVTAFSLLGGASLLLLSAIPRMAEGWRVLRTAGTYLTGSVRGSSASLGVYTTQVTAAGVASRTAATGINTAATSTAVMSTRMGRLQQNTGLATTRMGRLNQTATRTSRTMRGLGGASRIAGGGLMMFGGPMGMIGGLALSFLPELLKFGKGIVMTGVNAVKSAGGFMKLAKGGFGLFNILKKGAGVVSLLRGGLSLLGGPVGLLITGVTLLGEAGFKYYDNLQKRVLPATIDFGDKVSESTSKAINAYKDMETKANAKLDSLYRNQTKITDDLAKDMTGKFSEMAGALKKGYQDSADKALDVLGKFYAENDSLKGKDEQKILNNIKEGNEKKQKEIEKHENKVKKIYEKAAKEHRELTKEEWKEVKKHTQAINKEIKTALTKSKDEQTLISKKLKAETSNLSAKQAAATVKHSKDAKDKVISNAKKEAAAVIKEADDQRYVKKTISKKQHDETVKAAKEQREKTIKEAEKSHKGVVKEAKKQAAGHIEQVDWETGEVLGAWDTFLVDLAGVVNTITGGINKVLEFMNIPTIPEWKPKGYGSKKDGAKHSYAKGTDYHPGGRALVGEEGYELAHTPGIGTYMVGVGGPQIWDLPRGTSVLPHDQTKKITSQGLPGYAGGVGDFFKKGAKKAGEVVGKVKDFGSDIFELVMAGPKKIISNIFGGLIPFKTGKGIDGLGTGILKTIQKGALGFLTKSLGDFGGDGGSFKGVGGSAAVKKWVAQAISITGISPSYAKALETIAMKESSGNPTLVNRWDSNWKAGHPSQGLMQFIPSTFAAYKKPGYGNIKHPVHQIVAAINYLNKRYGGIYNHPGLKSMARGGPYIGYASGGVIDNHQIAQLGENGWREYAITTEPKYRKRSLQLYSNLGKELGVPSFGDGMISTALQMLDRISNKGDKPQSRQQDGSDMRQMIENQNKQIGLMAQQIDLLSQGLMMMQKGFEQLISKDSNNYMDGRKLDQTTGERFRKEAFMSGVR